MAKGRTCVRWTAELRLALHLMEIQFSFTWEEKVAVFNSMFNDYLGQCNLPGGARTSQLTAQYHERNFPQRRHVWEEILNAPDSPAEAERCAKIVAEITSVAQSLGIRSKCSTTPKSCDPSNSGPVLPITPQSRQQDQVGDVLETPSTSETPVVLTPPETPAAWRLHDRMSPGITYVQGSTNTSNSTNAQSPLHKVQKDFWVSTPRAQYRRRVPPTNVNEHDREDDTESDSDDENDGDYIDNNDRPDESEAEVSLTSPTARKRQRNLLAMQLASCVSPGHIRTVIPRPVTPTPSKTRQSATTRLGRARVEKFPHVMPAGNSIMLTQQQITTLQGARLEVPSEADVYPPLSGLLFRYWDDRSQSPLNERREFIARRFRDCNVDVHPPWKLDDARFPWQDIFLHINKNDVATPFISTSNNLFWVLRLALKEASRGATNGRIALIDATKIQRRAVLYVQPLHKALKVTRGFTNGAYMYHGQHEFIVYHKIPASSIVSAFSIEQLRDLTTTTQCLAGLLELDVMSTRADWKTSILPFLSVKAVKWTDPGIVQAVATLANLFTLAIASNPNFIRHLVTDIIQGWGFQVEHAITDEWVRIASTFANALLRLSNSDNFALRDMQLIKLGFLDGIRMALGPFNAAHTEQSMEQTLRAARRVGLEDPARMLAREADGTKLHVCMHQIKRQKLLNGSTRAALLEAPSAAHDVDGAHEEADDIDGNLAVAYFTSAF